MKLCTRGAALLGVLALCACSVPRPLAQPPVSGADELSPSQLIAAVQADAQRIDHSKDAAERTGLLATASANAQQCVTLSPDNGGCHYVRAQLLGLTARERPVQAVALLKDMLASLKQAEGLDPTFDHAGPARLTATVLLRAPGWPLGPGDADAAVIAAQRAVDREPDYPPNLITLAQALAKTEATVRARETYEKARRAVPAWTDVTPDVATARAEWTQEVEQGVRDLR
jgi:tetratricopeptide (TPR) repeat protein